MKIGFITDIHGAPNTMQWLEEAAKRYDLLCIGGDIGEIGLLYSMVDFAKRAPVPVVMVLGNHDYHIPELFAKDSPVLHGNMVKVAGLHVGGVGGALPTGGWPLELDETEFARLLRSLGPVDILVAHQPPKDICDLTYYSEHVGSDEVRKYIEESMPILVLTGHIHEGKGIGTIGGTVVVNPGPFHRGCYAEVDVDIDRIIVRLRNTDEHEGHSYKKHVFPAAMELSQEEIGILARLAGEGPVRLYENRFRQEPEVLQPLVNKLLVTATVGREGIKTWWDVQLTKKGRHVAERLVGALEQYDEAP